MEWAAGDGGAVAEVGIQALRVVAGGALVVAFALISEIVKPKALAGLFAARSGWPPAAPWPPPLR
jgi:hypothetical protein